MARMARIEVRGFSGNANHGKILGAGTVAGKNGRATAFSGSDYVSLSVGPCKIVTPRVKNA